VLITLLSPDRDAKKNQQTGITLLKQISAPLGKVELDIVIVDVRMGTRQQSMSSAVIRAKKQDALDFAAGRITQAQLVARFVK